MTSCYSTPGPPLLSYLNSVAWQMSYRALYYVKHKLWYFWLIKYRFRGKVNWKILDTVASVLISMILCFALFLKDICHVTECRYSTTSVLTTSLLQQKNRFLRVGMKVLSKWPRVSEQNWPVRQTMHTVHVVSLDLFHQILLLSLMLNCLISKIQSKFFITAK